ncbi:MAG: PTS glucitol/sorbitol transporter subunit IIA [Eubacterium sp.]|nr:PTS glucitol/sorbitol transporter subunit IIA [Eubacterium sp.]
MKYHAEVTGWGEDALEFLSEDMNFIVIFNDNAPAELKEIAILHTITQLGEDPAPGDTLILGDKVFDITAVGEEAKHTLRTLGHCTFNFNGGSEAERPGMIMVKGDEPLTAEDVIVGMLIEII